MSADRWSHCPKCSLNKVDYVKDAEAQYGKVPFSEFNKVLEVAKKAKPPEETLREDYDFYSNGFTLEIEYSCRCDVCGFHYTLQKESKMPSS